MSSTSIFGDPANSQLAGITSALEQAKKTTGKPTLVNIRTIIGLGSQKQNTGSVHGAALGPEDVRYVKQQLGFNPDEKFVASEVIYDYFKNVPAEGAKLEAEYNEMMGRYAKQYPEEHKELTRRLDGKLRLGKGFADKRTVAAGCDPDAKGEWVGGAGARAQG